METTLSQELVKQVEQELIKLDKDSPLEIWWDYRDELSDEHIAKIIAGDSWEVEEEIWEMNTDHIYDLGMQRLEEAFDNVNEDEDLDFEELKYDLRDELLEYLQVDVNLKDLIDRVGDVNVRIEMLSNYDCINSHHFETYGGGGYEYVDSYFGDMVDALNLNPKKVKQILKEKEVNTFGRWRDKPSRNGNELVSYDEFWQELENSICGANLLTFMATIDLNKYLENRDEIKEVTIPKGNFCGLYSSMQGGGSVLEMELQRDFTVKLETKDYFGYRMVLDNDDCGYSIHEVYGMHQSAWRNSLKL